jgi:hypothetical protein
LPALPGQAAATFSPHVGTTCAQAAAFPEGSAVVGIAATPDDGGYWIVTNDGYVAACGDASYLGQHVFDCDEEIVMGWWIADLDPRRPPL